MIKSKTHKVTEYCAGNLCVAPSYFVNSQLLSVLCRLEVGLSSFGPVDMNSGQRNAFLKFLKETVFKAGLQQLIMSSA